MDFQIKKSQIAINAADARPSRFTGGERIDCAISELDHDKRKVALSIKLLEEIEKKEALEKYGSEGQSGRIKAYIGLNGPKIFSLPALDVGAQPFSQRARKRGQRLSWLVVEGWMNKRTKTNPTTRPNWTHKIRTSGRVCPKQKEKYISPNRNRFAQNVRSPQDLAREAQNRDSVCGPGAARSCPH